MVQLASIMHFLVLLSVLVACAADGPFITATPKPDVPVVAGRPTEIEIHPHQVAVLYSGSLRCGGSIISPDSVVTAASCVAGVGISSLTVRAGSTNYASGGTIYRVREGRIHDRYNPESRDYNVAVLKVEPPITYSERARNITLEDSEVPAGISVVVTGWGNTWTEVPSSPYLLKATVEVREKDKCYVSVYGVFAERMICAGTSYGGNGPCSFDAGGQLTTLYCPPRLVGIASYGRRECGHDIYPAVYTKVSAVRSWIVGYCGL